ncbi:type II secretion system F family protein [Acidipropionibacterium timonense]|uniref:type II secretion system F family protein n=1 Tax=Acidipropionibacterium timonense TaxID=2161818 RepID=UPI0010306F87|nr:type II secretion system F family protein [Acidipropionibacterium timonense]
MSTVLAGLCGVLVVGGIILLLVGLVPRPRPSTPLSTRLWTTVDRRFRDLPAPLRRRIGIGLCLGIVGSVFTGWVVLVVLVPVLLAVLPALLANPPDKDLVVLAALERWVRLLCGSASTGKSVLDAIRATRAQAPDDLAGPLEALVIRLDSRWQPRDALVRFADDLDSPDADQVVAAIILAAELGGTGATSTLLALASSMQDRLRAHREIATERAKPRIVVRQVTVIVGVVLVVALAVGRDYFHPYATGPGQVLLCAYCAMYVGALWVLDRRSRPRSRERILVGVGAGHV